MKTSFVLASTHIGTMIVNRYDRVITQNNESGVLGYGVGFQLLEHGCFDQAELAMTLNLLSLKRKYRGDGVIAADVGANIGAFTVPWARHMDGWGRVYAFEAQERIFYALAGNITLNNCANARVFLAAVGVTTDGEREVVPQLNFDREGSYGSLSLRLDKSDVGQEVTDETPRAAVLTCRLDSFFWGKRLDLVKIDVEGMELEVLSGAEEPIDREHPILIVEHLKSNKSDLHQWMEQRGYSVIVDGLNYLGVHRDDPCLKHVRER